MKVLVGRINAFIFLSAKKSITEAETLKEIIKFIPAMRSEEHTSELQSLA